MLLFLFLVGFPKIKVEKSRKAYSPEIKNEDCLAPGKKLGLSVPGKLCCDNPFPVMSKSGKLLCSKKPVEDWDKPGENSFPVKIEDNCEKNGIFSITMFAAEFDSASIFARNIYESEAEKIYQPLKTRKRNLIKDISQRFDGNEDWYPLVYMKKKARSNNFIIHSRGNSFTKKAARKDINKFITLKTRCHKNPVKTREYSIIAKGPGHNGDEILKKAYVFSGEPPENIPNSQPTDMPTEDPSNPPCNQVCNKCPGEDPVTSCYREGYSPPACTPKDECQKDSDCGNTCENYCEAGSRGVKECKKRTDKVLCQSDGVTCRNEPMTDGICCTDQDCRDNKVCEKGHCEEKRTCCFSFLSLLGINNDSEYRRMRGLAEDWLQEQSDCVEKQGVIETQDFIEIFNLTKDAELLRDECNTIKGNIFGHSFGENFPVVYEICTYQGCGGKDIDLTVDGCSTCEDLESCKNLMEQYEGSGHVTIRANVVPVPMYFPWRAFTQFSKAGKCSPEINGVDCSTLDSWKSCFLQSSAIECENPDCSKSYRMCCASNSDLENIYRDYKAGKKGFPAASYRQTDNPYEKCQPRCMKIGPDVIHVDGGEKASFETTVCEDSNKLIEPFCFKDSVGFRTHECRYGCFADINKGYNRCRDSAEDGCEDGLVGCGTGCYDPQKQICCGGINIADKSKTCCGEMVYDLNDPSTGVCCNGKDLSVPIYNEKLSCCGDTSYNEAVFIKNRSVCCEGKGPFTPFPDETLGCCGDQDYVLNSQLCCSGNRIAEKDTGC